MSGSPVVVTRSADRRRRASPRFWSLFAVSLLAMASFEGRSCGGPMDGDAAPSLVPLLGDSTAVSFGSDVEIKSETTALLLSFLGTAVPIGVGAPIVWEGAGSTPAAVFMVAGVLIGPALGHFYADRPGRAFAGIGIRLLAGAGVALGGLASGSEGGATGGATAVAAIGGILAGASILWDIVRAPHSARVHNEEVPQRHMAIFITPPTGAAGPQLCAATTF